MNETNTVSQEIRNELNKLFHIIDTGNEIFRPHTAKKDVPTISCPLVDGLPPDNPVCTCKSLLFGHDANCYYSKNHGR